MQAMWITLEMPIRALHTTLTTPGACIGPAVAPWTSEHAQAPWYFHPLQGLKKVPNEATSGFFVAKTTWDAWPLLCIEFKRKVFKIYEPFWNSASELVSSTFTKTKVSEETYRNGLVDVSCNVSLGIRLSLQGHHWDTEKPLAWSLTHSLHCCQEEGGTATGEKGNTLCQYPDPLQVHQGSTRGGGSQGARLSVPCLTENSAPGPEEPSSVHQ